MVSRDVIKRENVSRSGVLGRWGLAPFVIGGFLSCISVLFSFLVGLVGIDAWCTHLAFLISILLNTTIP